MNLNQVETQGNATQTRMAPPPECCM